jgi:hypothetical protein
MGNNVSSTPGRGGRPTLPRGLDPKITERLRRTGRLEGPIRAFEATPLVGESTEAARQAAQAWLVKRRAD